MGIVYLLKAPDDREYVGQTRCTLHKRVGEHDSFARHGGGGCPLVNEAIREFGIDAFTTEVLVECPDADLNRVERECIEQRGTLFPDGLNICKGGGVAPPHPQSKRFANEEGLPMYVLKRFLDGEHIGYRVSGHPMGPERRFISRDMLDNLERALAYWKFLEAQEEPLVIERVDRAKYIQHHGDGWCVKIPGQKPRHFTSTNKTKDEKYQLALEHVDRVKNGLLDPDAKHIRKIKDGYRVIYPDQKNKQFVAAKKTDTQKLELARDYLDRLRKGEVEENDPECPHVQYICKHTNGFRVQHPDHPWKSFRGAKIPRKEKYEAAKSYLRSLIGETEASSA